MEQFKIEHGIPIPDAHARVRYPFGKLEPGDSVLIAGKKGEQVRPATEYWRKKNGWKFRVRTVEGGARVWRVS